MSKLIKSFTSLNRTERLGVAGLLSVAAILVIIKTTMHYWVKPEPVKAEQRPGTLPVQNAHGGAEGIVGDKININTADSAELIAIKGIGKVLSHRILEKRRAIGKYESWEQVFEVYHFSENTRELLMKHFTIQ